jgi:hypothetical protein
MDELGLYYQIDGNIGLVNIAEREYIIKDLVLLYEIMSKFTKTIENEYSVSIKKIYTISGLAFKI